MHNMFVSDRRKKKSLSVARQPRVLKHEGTSSQCSLSVARQPRVLKHEGTSSQCFVGLSFMNNLIKIIPARAGHCTANYNLLFSPSMTDFDEFIHKNPT